MPGNTDFVHTCNSGNPTLDQEDKLEIRKPKWNWQGIANKASIKSKIRGNNVDSPTRRGARAATHYQRQHYQYIDFKGDC